jgi:hypothetical protein
VKNDESIQRVAGSFLISSVKEIIDTSAHIGNKELMEVILLSTLPRSSSHQWNTSAVV